MIRPRVTVTRRATVGTLGALRTQSIDDVRDVLRRIGEEWEEEVRTLVQAETQRREGRRHKTNTTHLDVSFQYRIVERAGDYPLLELTTKPGVSGAKVGSLEFGAKGERVITAKNTKYLRWGRAPGDLRNSKQRSVVWKPTGRSAKGYRFMRRARDRVLARRRGRG